MKTEIKAAAALMLLMISAPVLTACDKDVDDNTTDTTPAQAVMDYQLTVNDDMLNVLNLTVYYYDADGKVQSELLTANEWNKSVKAKLPATLGARLKVELKDSIDPTTIGQFTATYGYSYNGYAVSATDKVVGNIVNYSTDNTLAMQGNKIPTWLERHTDGLVKFLYTFANDGQATSSSWQ